MKKIIALFGLLLGMAACHKKEFSLFSYTNLFIGTAGDGNVSPSACVPFGMVQVGPDTRMENWRGACGYHDEDSVIIGFSHTHISGVGVPAWGDVLFMPTTGKIIFQSYLRNPYQRGYRSPFSKTTEKAMPGYYRVVLDNGPVEVELTATERVAFHAYHYPATDSANVIIDLTHRDIPREAFIHVINNNEIEGFRRTLGMANDHHVYFHASFSLPIQRYVIIADDSVVHDRRFTGTRIKACLTFRSDGKTPLLIKTGLSQVSCEKAFLNLKTEIPHWNFEEIKKAASLKWINKLSRIEVETDSEALKTIFYSALYRCFLNPQIASDVDGSYRGMDNRIHKAEGFIYYNVFSLWDTYRTLHPLFTLIDSATNVDLIKSLLVKYDQQPGRLVKWELASWDWGGMIGYPAVPVIVDAFMKGHRNFDVEKAWKAMTQTARSGKEGLDLWERYGFLPCDRIDQSVSRSMEMAYEDWCLAQMARAMGKKKDEEYYFRRSLFYRHLYDSTSRLMRPRMSNGCWLSPFITHRYTPHYTEACAWQYSCAAVHDMDGWIGLLGGKEKATQWFDAFFDTTGHSAPLRIGFYEQGNEFSHHVAYGYLFCGKSWKTQQLIRKIFSVCFSASPAGLPGNDDCGQMSAWVVMSALGLYPFCPGWPGYVFGTPLFQQAVIHLENGKTFTLSAQNVSAATPYINAMWLNGREYKAIYLPHDSIVRGGKLVFAMSASPNQLLGTENDAVPHFADTTIFDPGIPFIKIQENYFREKTLVAMEPSCKKSVIRYTLDGSDPDENSLVYTGPFPVYQTTCLKARCYRQGYLPGWIVCDTVYKAQMHEAIPVYPQKKRDEEHGLHWKFYPLSTSSLPDFSLWQPSREGSAEAIALPVTDQKDYYAITFEGYLRVPEDGIYTFYLMSDDGSRLIIDRQEVVVNDYFHPPVERTGKIGLKKGFHSFLLHYFENCGGEYLSLAWEGPHLKRQPVSSNFFYKTIKTTKEKNLRTKK